MKTSRVFVAHIDDALAQHALHALRDLGAATGCLKGPDPCAQCGESVLFTAAGDKRTEAFISKLHVRKIVLPKDTERGFILPGFALTGKEMFALTPRKDNPCDDPGFMTAMRNVYFRVNGVWIGPKRVRKTSRACPQSQAERKERMGL